MSDLTYELINGKEAMNAWYDGTEVLVRWLGNPTWYNLDEDATLEDFKDSGNAFRIKPKTIMLNGVEVPSPFKPKDDGTSTVYHQVLIQVTVLIRIKYLVSMTLIGQKMKLNKL